MVEAQEDAHHSLSQDVQSQDLSLGSACQSPVPLFSSYNNYVPQRPGGLGSPRGESLISYGFDLEDPIVSTSQTPPASHAVIEQIPSSIPGRSSSDLPFAQWGPVANTSQDSYDPSPGPRSDNSSSSSGKKTSDWLSPLHIAAQEGHDGMVRTLLQYSVDCDEKDNDGLAPLFHAVIEDHEDVVRSLLSYGARIGNVDGQQCSSALHWAALYRREKLLRILLDHCLRGSTLIDCYDELGRTPLHIAVDREFETGVLMLLQSGANPNYSLPAG